VIFIHTPYTAIIDNILCPAANYTKKSEHADELQTLWAKHDSFNFIAISHKVNSILLADVKFGFILNKLSQTENQFFQQLPN